MVEEEIKKIKEKETELKNQIIQANKEKKRKAEEAKQQQLTHQQNSLKLDVYWKAMDLEFHNSKDDALAALSVLSLYYKIITDYFSFYAALNAQIFIENKENKMITLQSYMHFLKLFGICTRKEEIDTYFQHLDTLIIQPLNDTLNINNGFNFAQFLEATLRIIMLKSESIETPEPELAYRNTLQEIFQNATINFEQKVVSDETIAEVYSAEAQQIFLDKYALL